MNKIALVTDSSCDLPSDIIKEKNIDIIPLRVIYKDKEFRDGVDITPEVVYSRLDQEIPKTSMPSPGDVLSKFNELKDKGYTHCIVITLSSGLSGTYNMVKMISQDVQGMLIEVIDSKKLSMGLGLVVLEAEKLIKQNIPFEQIISKINVLVTQVKGFFVIDTLEYLRKGGRIGKVAAVIGSVLNIKPIISFDDEGKYCAFGKVRGKNQGVEKMLQQLNKQLETAKSNVAILQGMAIDEANAIAKKLQSYTQIGKLYISQVSPAMVVHTGPGLLGIAFCPADI